MPGAAASVWSCGSLRRGLRLARVRPTERCSGPRFAPRQFAGRGLAYWTDGTQERVIVVTPGYHLASIDAKTGIPDPKFGKSGVVDLMDGLDLPLVPLAVDDSGPFIISDLAPYRQARPGETWDPVTKTGADGTVGIDPKYGQIAASSPAIVICRWWPGIDSWYASASAS